ncbi:hypothetical protein WME97_04240 [Sorangium sp. So ce367]
MHALSRVKKGDEDMASRKFYLYVGVLAEAARSSAIHDHDP